MKMYRHGLYYLGAIFILMISIMPLTAEAAMWVGSKPIDLGDDFVDGQPASAEEVNDKLNALKDAVNEMRICQGNDADDKMVRVGTLCVDQYEASLYPLSNWNEETNSVDVDVHAVDVSALSDFPKTGSTSYAARSVAGVMPATNVNWFQAQAACAMAGKRLLTNAEWQLAAGGTNIPACQLQGAIVETGAQENANCFSAWGVHDMAGNVGEWVSDWMQGNGDDLNNKASSDFGDDGIYGINEGGPIQQGFPPAIIRGGHAAGPGTVAGASDKVGIFALSAEYSPTSTLPDTGFRCARPLGVPPVNFRRVGLPPPTLNAP